MATPRMRTLIDRGLYFESPRFHDGKLWVADALTNKVVSVTLNKTSELVCKINGVPSGLGFLPNGDLVIVSMFRQKLYRCSDGEVSAYVDLAQVANGTLDDMIVDSAGNAYVGDLGFDLLQPGAASESREAGRLLLVSPKGEPRVVAEGLDFPNGIAISGDGKKLIVAESRANRLAEFSRAADGSLTFVRRFGNVAEPDGICLDTEGAVWVASFQADAFVRIARDGREITRIETPGRRAVACVLGGDDGRALFCVTADTTHEKLLQGKSQARVDVVSVDVPSDGLP
ncbi:MAG TPA: SMP-30/gluconolactonase/LRE family protein [Polyangiales bacterium]|jgi:sugar lactone lactonase YvrE|nr:SMP-30/gluconolactonase/LRE family protein [Polyangiales bacterium]